MSKGSGLRQGLSIAFRLGTELTVATCVGGVMGYAFDRFFETKPWGLAVGVLLGGAAGTLTVYHVAQQMTFDDNDNNNDDTTPGNE